MFEKEVFASTEVVTVPRCTIDHQGNLEDVYESKIVVSSVYGDTPAGARARIGDGSAIGAASRRIRANNIDDREPVWDAECISASSSTVAGSITFSAPAVTLAIAPGTTVYATGYSGGTSPTVNSSVCLVGLENGSSQLVSLTLSPGTTSQLTVCGVVSAYTAPTTTIGLLNIGSIVYPLATNAAAFTGVAVQTGANVCLSATLNGLGQITGGVAAANSVTTTTTPVNLCGTLSAYTPASGTALATIVFSSPASSYTVASGVTVGNTTLATAGSIVCLVGQISNNQLASASFALPVSSTITVCGTVAAYNPATNTTTGLLTIGGATLILASNISPSGIAISLQTNDCVVATLNSLGQAVAAAVSANTASTATATPTVTATASPTVTGTPPTATPTATVTSLVVCGVITNYVAAGTTTNGTLTINGQIVGLAPGLLFTGVTVQVGANVCISGLLNGTQQLTSGIVTSNAVTPTATTNIPPPPPPPGGVNTATPTATAIPTATATATATATLVPATNTPVPAQPTPTPKPAKAPKPTATATIAPAGGGGAPAPKPTAVPTPAHLPSTGFGGSAFARNAAIGRALRASNGKIAIPDGVTVLPQTGGSGDPLSPVVPAIIGLTAVGLGVLTRKLRASRR